jgi:hypothetical protein
VSWPSVQATCAHVDFSPPAFVAPHVKVYLVAPHVKVYLVAPHVKVYLGQNHIYICSIFGGEITKYTVYIYGSGQP